MMLSIHQLLVFHQDADHLRECGNFAVLHTDNREQFEHDQNEEYRHAEQHDRGLFDLRYASQDFNAPWPDRQHQERKAEHQEQQCIAFLEFELPEPAQRQPQQGSAKYHQDQTPNHGGSLSLDE